jgi:hypothetical protein
VRAPGDRRSLGRHPRDAVLLSHPAANAFRLFDSDKTEVVEAKRGAAGGAGILKYETVGGADGRA